MKTSASKAAVLEAGHLEGSGYSHMVNGKGGKQRTCIILRPTLEALAAYTQGRESGDVFEGRNMGISPRGRFRGCWTR